MNSQNPVSVPKLTRNDIIDDIIDVVIHIKYYYRKKLYALFVMSCLNTLLMIVMLIAIYYGMTKEFKNIIKNAILDIPICFPFYSYLLYSALVLYKKMNLKSEIHIKICIFAEKILNYQFALNMIVGTIFVSYFCMYGLDYSYRRFRSCENALYDVRTSAMIAPIVDDYDDFGHKDIDLTKRICNHLLSERNKKITICRFAMNERVKLIRDYVESENYWKSYAANKRCLNDTFSFKQISENTFEIQGRAQLYNNSCDICLTEILSENGLSMYDKRSNFRNCIKYGKIKCDHNR